MDDYCFNLLVTNAVAYIVLFIVYQIKKKFIDIGSILLLTWIVGSTGATYYYTFEVTYLSYDNITGLPLILLFVINCLLFSPFLRINYNNIKNIEVYNLGNVFNAISIFFALVNIMPMIDVILKLSSFSFVGATLADMYSADEDKTNLIFSPYIRPFFSVMRHFTVFIIFLFFYQLSKRKNNKFIIIGLAGNIVTFILVSFLSGSRGGIISLLMTCAYFFFFMKNIMKPSVVRILMRMTLIIVDLVVIGVAAISSSRLSDMSDEMGKSLFMDQWISQYAGEGIIRYDHTIWHLEKHLNGQQNLPYLYSFLDDSIKDLESYAAKAESVLNTPVTVFYSYVGDLVIDFGIIGTCIVALILFMMIRYLTKIRKGKISFYHLIILSFFYEYLLIGFTANIYRTYYTQIQIVDTIVLLGIIYIFQKINEKRYALSCNSNPSI